MSYTSPSLATVLANEQTMNTNLIAYRARLRNALDTLGISYDSSDTILDLIRLLDWPVPYGEISGTSSNSDVEALFDSGIAMCEPAGSFDDWLADWKIYQMSASPSYSFCPYVLGGMNTMSSSGQATGVALMYDNEMDSYNNNGWSIECDMQPATSSNTAQYRGLAVMFGTSFSDYSTYYGVCAGLTRQSSSNDAFTGYWKNTNLPTYTYSSSDIYSGEEYHIKISCSNYSYINLKVTDVEMQVDLINSNIYFSNINVPVSTRIRLGVFSSFYASEVPVYGPANKMYNFEVNTGGS